MAMAVGAYVDATGRVEIWIENLARGDAGKQGGIVQRYNAEAVSRSYQERAIAKVGAKISMYDPEIMALLATEL